VPRKPTESEADIQRTIGEYLTLRRFLWWRNQSGKVRVAGGYMKLGPTGAPDIYVLREGTLYGLEIKNAKNEQSRAQAEFEHEFVRQGGRYFVCRSLQDAIDALK
jgi:hypothetical protein